VNRVRELFIGFFGEVPSRIDNMFIGAYEIALGLWLFLPFDAFGPTLHFASGRAPFDPIEESHVAAALVSVGIAQMYLAWRRRWGGLRILTLPNAMLWGFIVAGYAIVLPKSTPLITSIAFLLLIMYEYMELSYWCHRQKLRNNQNIGNI